MKETTKLIVTEVLQMYPESRDNDFVLASIVYRRLGYASDSLSDLARIESKPSYESITRFRRMIQRSIPALRGTKAKEREEEEQTYHDYFSEAEKDGD